jgi:PAS domain S-box-containing protein
MESPSGDIYKRLAAVVETAIDGIITIDRNGIMETVNRAAAEQFGYTREELIGQKVNMLMSQHDAKHHDMYIDNYVSTRKPKIIGIGREVIGKRKDGSVFTFRLAVSEVVLNDRVVFTGIIHDVSDIKKAEQQILRLNRKLEEKVQQRTNELETVVNQLLRTNRDLAQREIQLEEALKRERELGELKSRFVSMASHEFRTPLSTILSSASLIGKYTEGDGQEKRERHISKIKSAVENLTGILNDFLSLSKLEEGKVQLEVTDVDLKDLGLNIIEDLHGITKKNQKIILDVSDLCQIKSDKRILTNILFNLLSNAIKYSGEGTEVLFQGEIEGEQLVIKVKDEGIGIPEEEQKHIFSRFFRAKNVENIKGTGLGLNIVQRYVELLNGSINFESKSNKGTTFTIHLPIAWQNES